jgi:hypothetical protein
VIKQQDRREKVRKKIFFYIYFAVLSFCIYSQETQELYAGKPIVDITFEGLNHTDSFHIKNECESYVGRKFSPSLFDDIQSKLYDIGYFDQISGVVKPSGNDGGGVILHFNVHEAIFGGIEFSGNTVFSTGELYTVVYSETGTLYNPQKIEEDIQRIQNLYIKNGYLFSSFAGEKTMNSDGRYYYRINIIEGALAIIENIIIIGNNRIDENMILEKFPLKKGDSYSFEKVLEGFQNIYNMNIFSMIIPEVSPGSQKPYIIIALTVEEKSENNPAYYKEIYQIEKTFAGEGFGFSYLEDELTDLSLFYKTHGNPITVDERVSVNRYDGIIDKIILLEYENFNAKFIQYGEREHNETKEELINITSKIGVEYLYGIKNGMELDDLFGIIGDREILYGNSIWLTNDEGNIAVIFIREEKIDYITWIYSLEEYR